MSSLVNTHPLIVLQMSLVQGLLSLQVKGDPGWQVPPKHASPTVQALLSVQAVPSGTPAQVVQPGVGDIVRTQLPVAESQESIVQVLLSSQLLAVPAQTAFLHTSLTVQGLLSLHDKVLGLCTQPPGMIGTHESVVQTLLSSQFFVVKTHPVAVLHVSTVQLLLSLQVLAAPEQTPFEHASFTVQALPSLHDDVLFVWTHPVAVLQVSVVQTLLSSQLMVVYTHPVAELQESVVHALLSLQVIGVWVTAPVVLLHASVVQALLSSTTTGVKTHPVAGSQESVVQRLPSQQNLKAKTQPVVGLHESSVQALLSLQVIVVPLQ